MASGTTSTAVTVELSAEARKKVAWFMERTLQSLSAMAGEKAKLICGNSITEQVLQELPDATLSWTFNTEPLAMDPSRIFYYKENLDITDLLPRDSGVYACLVTWGTDDTVKQNLTLGVFSLEVETTSPTRYVFDHESTKMDCHSVTLGELFPDALRYWLFNGTHTSALPVTKASNKTIDVINSVNKFMSGVWECQVLQQRTERVWASAWYNLSVQDAPTSADRAFRKVQDNWYTVVVVVTIFLILFVLIFCFSAFKLKKIQDAADEKFLDERLGWEETIIKHGENGKIDIHKLTPPSSLKDDQSDYSDFANNHKSYEEDMIFPVRNSKGRAGTVFPLGDGGDGDGESRASQEDSENESETLTRSNTSDDVNLSSIFSQPGRSRKLMREKNKGHYLREGRKKAQPDMGFGGDDNENKFTTNKIPTSTRAVKFGENILAKHRDRGLPPATREDALSWLNINSSLTKSKKWSLKFKSYLVPQSDLTVRTLNINRNSAALNEQDLNWSKKHNQDTTENAKVQMVRTHKKRKILDCENRSFAPNSKSAASDGRARGRALLSSSGQLRIERSQRGGRQAETYPAGGSGAVMRCENGVGDDLINVTAGTEEIVSFARKGSYQFATSESTVETDDHMSRQLPWKRWLRSKFPWGSYDSSAWPKKSFLGLKKDVVYTALFQHDDYPY